jgi:hypothetical protein
MTDPHVANPEEDPERCIGQEIPDPAEWAQARGEESGTPLFDDAVNWFGQPGGSAG